MNDVASVFPVKPLFDSLLTAFDPPTTGIGIAWGDLAVVAAWGVAGVDRWRCGCSAGRPPTAEL